MCVRNVEIENIHADEQLITKTGGYSDAKGNEFAWPGISPISDNEMQVLMD